MITMFWMDEFFSVVNWLLGWIPATAELILTEKITNIFGYGVWLLGDNVFTAISVIGMSEVMGYAVFSVVIFVYRLIRG